MSGTFRAIGDHTPLTQSGMPTGEIETLLRELIHVIMRKNLDIEVVPSEVKVEPLPIKLVVEAAPVTVTPQISVSAPEIPKIEPLVIVRGVTTKSLILAALFPTAAIVLDIIIRFLVSRGTL